MVKFNKKNITIFIIVILLAIFPFLLSLFNYECPYKKFFNLYCPGCGTTRMFKSLFKLQFYQAFRFNPLMFIIFVVVIPIYLILNIISYKKDKKFLKISKKQIIMFFIVMLIYFVVRNTVIYFIPTEI